MEAIGPGRPAKPGRPTPRRCYSQEKRGKPELQATDDQPSPHDRTLLVSGRPSPYRRPCQRPQIKNYGNPKESGRPCQRPQNRICGHPRNPGRPGPREPPDDRRPTDVWTLVASSCGLMPLYPFTSPLICTMTINRLLPPPS